MQLGLEVPGQPELAAMAGVQPSEVTLLLVALAAVGEVPEVRLLVEVEEEEAALQGLLVAQALVLAVVRGQEMRARLAAMEEILRSEEEAAAGEITQAELGLEAAADMAAEVVVEVAQARTEKLAVKAIKAVEEEAVEHMPLLWAAREALPYLAAREALAGITQTAVPQGRLRVAAEGAVTPRAATEQQGRSS